MVRLAAAVALFAGLSSVLGATGTSTASWLRKRATPVTGCTCCGFDVSFGSDIHNMITYFILNWANGPSSSNTGFCFLNGELEDVYVDMIRTALETRVSTPYVNATGAWTRCELWGISDVDACLDNIVTGYSKFIVGADGTTSSEWIHKGCAYPSANYVPTDCYCGWECAEGFTQCGNSCIDASVTTCQSGVAITKTRRSNIPVCDAGAELCPMPLKGFECLNTSSDLEACGGCPFQQGSVDCTSLPGVDHVECIGGECKVNSCARGWVLVDGQCQVA